MATRAGCENSSAGGALFAVRRVAKIPLPISAPANACVIVSIRGFDAPGERYITRIKGEVFAITRPILRAATLCRVIAARMLSVAVGAAAINSPPEVCGSKSSARYSSGTSVENFAHSSINARLLFSPPEKFPPRAASNAPGNIRSPHIRFQATLPRFRSPDRQATFRSHVPTN